MELRSWRSQARFRCWVGIVLLLWVGASDAWSESAYGTSELHSLTSTELKEAQGTDAASTGVVNRPKDVEAEEDAAARSREQEIAEVVRLTQEVQERAKAASVKAVSTQSDESAAKKHYVTKQINAIGKQDLDQKHRFRKEMQSAQKNTLEVPMRDLARTLQETREALETAKSLSKFQEQVYSEAKHAKKQAAQLVHKALAARNSESYKKKQIDMLKANYTDIFAPVLDTNATNATTMAELKAYGDKLPNVVQKVLRARARRWKRNATETLKESLGAQYQSSMLTSVTAAVQAKVGSMAQTVANKVRAMANKMKRDGLGMMLEGMHAVAEPSSPLMEAKVNDDMMQAYEYVKRDNRFGGWHQWDRVKSAASMTLSHPVRVAEMTKQAAVAKAKLDWDMTLAAPLLEDKEENMFLKYVKVHQDHVEATDEEREIMRAKEEAEQQEQEDQQQQEKEKAQQQQKEDAQQQQKEDAQQQKEDGQQQKEKEKEKEEKEKEKEGAENGEVPTPEERKRVEKMTANMTPEDKKAEGAPAPPQTPSKEEAEKTDNTKLPAEEVERMAAAELKKQQSP